MGSPWPRKSQRVAALSSTLSACSRTPLFGNAKALCGSTCLSCYSHTELRVAHSHGLLVACKGMETYTEHGCQAPYNKKLKKSCSVLSVGFSGWGCGFYPSSHTHQNRHRPDRRTNARSIGWHGGPTYRGGGGRALALSV